MEINKYIEHTLLKADATAEQIIKLCNEAKEYHFATVCVNTSRVPLAYSILADSDVNVCCVVGFPLGAASSKSKAFETKQAIKDGAKEIDMVVNIGLVKDGNWKEVGKDIKAVVKAAKDVPVKVIFENCLLTDKEKVKLCKVAVKAGVAYVKTSTGFSTGGATIEDVILMKKNVDGKAKVKAAGGIRSYEEAMKMIEAGADRLGTSAGIGIINGANMG